MSFGRARECLRKIGMPVGADGMRRRGFGGASLRNRACGRFKGAEFDRLSHGAARRIDHSQDFAAKAFLHAGVDPFGQELFERRTHARQLSVGNRAQLFERRFGRKGLGIGAVFGCSGKKRFERERLGRHRVGDVDAARFERALQIESAELEN